MTTLAEAQDMLARYMQAEKDVLDGKEVRLGGTGLDRWLKMEDLAEIRKGRVEWEARVAALSTSSEISTAPRIGGMTFGVARFDGPPL
jgi:hypothetical protein